MKISISKGKSPRQKITKVTETLNFGKYKDSLFIKDIIACDAAYILWLEYSEIVEFSDSIIQKAEREAKEQHREYLLETYGDSEYYENWGDND